MLSTANSRRNGISRTVSGSSADNNSVSQRKKRPPQQSQQRYRRHPTPASTEYSRLFWIVLLFGLGICILDVMYVMRYVTVRNDNDEDAATAARIPQVVHKEGDTDDGILPPSDGDDDPAVLRKNSKSIFANPIGNINEKPEKVTLPQPDAVAAAATETDADSDADTGTDAETAVDADTDSKDDNETDNEADTSTTGNKEPILALLREAGVALDDEMIAKLPTWDQFTDMYGEEPFVVGLDTCHKFQFDNGDPANHFVSTSGTFNTGTNLMAELLIHNCHMPARMAKFGRKSRGVRWQVLWGKHTPVGDEEFRRNHKTYKDANDNMTASGVFPAVTVRDPFKWMQSMCRHNYAAHWHHNLTHCPNLVPNDNDRETFPQLVGKESVPVMIHYAEFRKHHTSLAGFWNDWYNEYINAPFPRLIVRFEDIIFRPKEVTRIACQCAGGELNDGPFHYIVDSAKKGKVHGSQKTSYVDALIKYGSEKGRYDGFEQADLEYAKEHLDPNLMRLFGYKYAPEELPIEATES